MSNISRWNLVFGFSAIVFSASGGFFLATEQSRHFVQNAVGDSSWWFILSSSAHGHTNLFGMLHVLMALTFPYSRFGSRIQAYQTYGLGAGTFAMSFLMVIRSLSKPVIDFDLLGILIGLFLSCSLLSLITQIVGLLKIKPGRP